MKAWILTAVFAVSLIGGAALAVASDGDTVSDDTVTVYLLDIGNVIVAPTHDAVTAHQQVEHSPIGKASGVPAFAKVFVNATLSEHDDFRHRRTEHRGKLMVDGHLANCEDCHGRVDAQPQAYPHRC